jgi:Ser/Thr protein kinase RdoA (MazF antagonist)
MTMTNHHNGPSDSETIKEVLERAYNVKVHGIIKLKTVYGIVSETAERYIWKFVFNDDAQLRIEQLTPVLQSLSLHGISVAFPVRALDGRIVTTTADGRRGYLQTWLRGKHVNYEIAKEREDSIITVARMHRASQRILFDGVVPIEWSLPGGSLQNKMRLKRNALHEIWARARAHFAELSSVESSVFEGCEQAYRAVSSVPMDANRFARAFCHRDLAPHNLILLENESKIALIDFDVSGIDDPFLDVMQIANHYVFSGRLKAGDLYRHVEVYMSNFPEQRARIRTLWDLLRFPDVLLRALTEWRKAGFPREHMRKVRSAIHAERIRTVTWKTDYVRFATRQTTLSRYHKT